MSAKATKSIYATPEVSTVRHGEFAWPLLDLINSIAQKDWATAAQLSHQIQDHADEHDVTEFTEN